MGHARNDDAIDLVENFFEWRGRFRRRSIQLRQNRARFRVRRNAPLGNLFPIISDPIRELVQLIAENFRRNIAKIVLSIFHIW